MLNLYDELFSLPETSVTHRRAYSLGLDLTRETPVSCVRGLLWNLLVFSYASSDWHSDIVSCIRLPTKIDPSLIQRPAKWLWQFGEACFGVCVCERLQLQHRWGGWNSVGRVEENNIGTIAMCFRQTWPEDQVEFLRSFYFKQCSIGMMILRPRTYPFCKAQKDISAVGICGLLWI